MAKRWLSVILTLFVVFNSVLPTSSQGSASKVEAPLNHVDTSDLSVGPFRTHITLAHATDRARLDQLGVVVLDEGPDWALVLADAEQLTTLARLRFEPRASDDLSSLIAAHSKDIPQLAKSLQPLLAQADRVRSLTARGVLSQPAETPPELTEANALLRAALHGLTSEQRMGIAALTSVDDDGDGLTNTQEQWWCTDPLNANSDGDAQGYTDGQEVAALLNFTLPRATRWAYGPPFGPPNAWPDFNGQDGNPATPACNDGDYDTIPDYAEVFMVGSKVPEESTDHDKFDDGQELFGVTYCPGAPTSCGYGSYPRIEYWNYIKATMPTWVLPPGDNIFVAAFPVPEVSVIPGSWTVERVTTITTQEGQMTQQEHSYETSVMRGESSSIANTVTWNNWEEVSQAVETPLARSSGQQFSAPNGIHWGKLIGGTLQVVGGGIGIAAACVTAGTVTLGAGCVAALAVGLPVIGSGLSDWSEVKSPDEVQNSLKVNNINSNVNINQVSSTASASAQVVNEIDFQGVVNSLDGVQYAINQQGQLLARGLQDISYQLSRPRYTETRTNGHSWGGAQTTTHEVYEEHTISEGEAFTTGENWSTAWAVDSSHAANLTFNYTIQNAGTEYARELTGLVFNIYLGDDTTPIISYPAWQQFPSGKLENVFPGAVNTFASTAIPLTLEQMKRIDLGDRLTVVLEDYSYGADELFYQDAVNGGMTVFIEDGVDDGDETVDSYVIPTWGIESVQDVLTRFFPAGYDLDGNLNALWTPEFDGINPPTWNEHYLSDIAWWNVYLTQADAGNTPLKDLSAQAGSALLFRFNRDSDRDGYQDRVEVRYGTDKNDPTSHPQPEVLAGYVAGRSGNVVTVKLVLENSGTFDAYGIDAVMYAPDATTTIGNNTVGGNGRVRPGAHVAVGSLVKSPALNGWGSSTAQPYAGGQFTGSADRVFTFSAATPGVVGQDSTAMTWNDGAGNSGTLALGSSYHAPLPLDVAQGLQVGFNTGTILAGSTFTVAALTPRDTFTYTINSEPYTPPVIVVSYSDPQGSHRFVTPVELPNMDTVLAPYTGQMLKGIALEVATTAPVTATAANVTNLIVNSPHPATIQDGHLYVNFVSDGRLVAELPFTLTFPSGPTVFPVTWSTAVFSETYDPAADNILIAFWTDAQGNIIDSAARPLNTFAADPRPAFAMPAADATWNFGTATQGEVLNHTFTFASTGFRDLYTYLASPAGLTVAGAASQYVAPGDTVRYTVTLDTAALPVGPYNQTITIRTSDPNNSTRTIQVQGTISTLTAQALPAPIPYRPWDQMTYVPGPHQVNDVITFTHTITPDAIRIHPLYVYDQNRTQFLGNGEYGQAGAGVMGASSSGYMSTMTPNVLSPAALATSDWWATVQKNIYQSEYQVTWQSQASGEDMPAAYQAPNRAHNLRTYFTPTGLRIIPRTCNIGETCSIPAWGLDLALTGYGYTGDTQPVTAATLSVSANRIEYHRADLASGSKQQFTEWYVNSELGLEQHFTLVAPPQSEAQAPQPEIVLELALSGSLIPNITANESAIEFTTADGVPALRYSRLRATDVTGHFLPAHFSLLRPSIRIDTTNAVYPITINAILTGPSTTPNWMAESNQAASEFGAAVGTAGDVNGDGYDDIIVGAYFYDNGQTDEGQAFVYYGSASGPSTTANWTAESNQESARFGHSVGTAGDVNGDGYADVIVGAPLYDNEQLDEGRVFVYYGSASGLSTTANWTTESDQGSVQMGHGQIGTAGDVNGDGYDDVIIGACLYDNGESNEGRVLVYHGSASGLGTTPNWMVESNQENARLGCSVGTAGDINGDGYADVIIGAGYYSNGQANEGRVFVYHGSASGLNLTANWTAESNQADAEFGWRAGTAGDLNGDGYSDIIVGSEGYDNGQTDEGAVFVWYGSATGLGTNGNPTNADWMGESDQSNAYFGQSVDTVGDVNGDHYDDVIVGASLYDNGQTDEGAAFVWYGSAVGLGANGTITNADWMAETNQDNAQVGEVGTAGDVNSDGGDDIVIGAPYYDNGQTDEGAAFVYYGSPPPYIIKQSPPGSNGVEFTLPTSSTTYSRYWLQYGERITTTGAISTGLATVRLPKQSYANATLDVLLLQAGMTTPSTPTLTLDVGANGSIEWITTRSFTMPLLFGSPDFGSALSAYVLSATPDAQGYVTISLRVTLNMTGDLFLTNFVATPGSSVDVMPSASGITFSATNPTESELVTVTATLSNTGSVGTGGLTAAFYAALPTWGIAYIGSAFVPNIPAGGTAQARIPWDTFGFTGTVPVRVMVDPYNRLVETNETNNEVTTTLTIRTRPDLQLSDLRLSNPEPVVGENVTVTLTLRNAGQAQAGTETIALYLSDPGGTVVGTSSSPSLVGGMTTTVAFPWTPATPGPVRLFARADRDNTVNEFDESNNDYWNDLYVGFRGPILLDSGGSSDPPYSSTVGYGYLDEGQPDVTPSCGSGQFYETQRLDPGGRVVYRFDHLLPGHFYHLDATLYECDGAGRQESIFVDGNLIAGPEDLSDGLIHRLSLRLDPVLYADHALSVTVEAPGIDGAVVSAINLYDIDYRYADAGGTLDPQYPGGTWAGLGRPYGWGNGTLNITWGTLPYQSVRVNQITNTVYYRFNGLVANRQYQVNLTFWQPSGAARVQKVQIDGQDTGLSVNTGDYQIHRVTADVPSAAYAMDGSILVGVVRTNAPTGAFINEIALEELTAVLPPVADFTAEPTHGYAPLAVQFTDRSSGSISGRLWTFGDGAVDSLPNPLHTYTAPGLYTVTLTVSGPGGSHMLSRPAFITATAIPPTSTVVAIAPAVASAGVGTPTTVTVAISNVTNLGSFQFTLAFSPTLVQVQGITLGEFPASSGRTFTPVGPTIDNQAGTADFGAFSLGASPAGPNGSGTLAYIRLQPVTGGSAALHLANVQVVNVPGNTISVIARDGVLSIAACLGDFDGDGDIDILDVQRVAYRWNTYFGQTLYDVLYDLDGDGDIDIVDVQRVAYRWGTHCSSRMARAARNTVALESATLSIQPYSRTVTAGQTFTAGVVISQVVDLGAFEFTIGYSASVMTVLSATIGSFPGSSGRTFSAVGPIISPTAGTVAFGAFSMGTTPPGVDGNGTLAILTLRSLAEGQSDLVFQAAQVSDRTAVGQPIGAMLSGQVIIMSGGKIYLPLVLRKQQ